MNNVDELNDFLLRVTSDAKITTTHIGICTALAVAWIENGLQSPIRISRRRLMVTAKIKSTTTYHKIISDLTSLKYVKYEPSFHPGEASKIFILASRNEKDSLLPGSIAAV
jgi:hypothetical protein